MAMGRLCDKFDEYDVDTSLFALAVTRSSTPKKPGVLGADVTASSTSSDLALWFEASDNSDELDKVRPGRAGRHRGERKGDGLKERAKLAMVISFGCVDDSLSNTPDSRKTLMQRMQLGVGGETCFAAKTKRRKRGAAGAAAEAALAGIRADGRVGG
jgi:hypothetical protein